MDLVHTAYRLSTSEVCDSFFGDLLGLTPSREYMVPANLMQGLFGINKEFQVRIYDIGDQKLEIFIGDLENEVNETRDRGWDGVIDEDGYDDRNNILGREGGGERNKVRHAEMEADMDEDEEGVGYGEGAYDSGNDKYTKRENMRYKLNDLDKNKLEGQKIITRKNRYTRVEEKVPSVNHLCLRVHDRQQFLKKSLNLGFQVVEWEREGKPNLVFVCDGDGNPYEIVE